MRDAYNIAEVAALQPDYLGFIFYPKSPRYVGEDWDSKIINQLPESIERVGVFVNEDMAFIQEACAKYGINTVQLHGSETPAFCSQVQSNGYTVFKAFQVDDDTKAESIEAYSGTCDCFLYDTKSKGLGGSGHKFNWDKLAELNDAGQFFLSGGITVDDAATIKELKFSNLFGVDINSRFEIEPALKDTTLLKEFVTKTRFITKK